MESNWRKEFLETIYGRKAPMILVPQEVADEVAKQLRENCQSKRRFRAACFIIIPLLYASIFLWAYYWHNPFSVICLPAIIVCVIVFYFLWQSSMDADACCLERGQLKTGKGIMAGTMKDFAIQFNELCKALGPKSREMGEWTNEQVIEYMKAVLRGWTYEVKKLQDASPGNPCAGAEEMLEFKRLYWMFTEWSQTDFGGFGQYFPDK